MGPIGWPELVLILVVLLVIFGPGKLPQVGEAIGRGIRELRRASSDLEDAVRGRPLPPDEADTRAIAAEDRLPSSRPAVTPPSKDERGD
jgi:sec-independent protein translocase protein TatA